MSRSTSRMIPLWGDFYPGAVLALDFVNNRYRVGGGRNGGSSFATLPNLTVTRATPALSYDATGAYSFGPNVARIVPGVGLLVEEARTNLFLNSFAPVTQTVTITAVSHTITVWGTGSVTIAAGTATISNGGAASAGSPRTIGCTVGGTITVTVTGSPSIVQVEAGACGTSPIPTLGSSVTRAVDVVKLAGLSIAPPYTILFDGSIANGAGEIYTANTNANGVLLYYPSSMTSVVRESSASTASIDTGVVSANVRFKTATRYAVNDVNAATNGSASTADASSTPPTLTVIGAANSAYGFSGANSNPTVKRLIIYPTGYTDAQLAAASA